MEKLWRLCLLILGSLLFLAGPGRTQTFFTDVTASVVPSFGPGRFTAIGDYDNDGWPDVIARKGSGGDVLLLHNQGGRLFTDQTAAMEVDWGPQGKGGGATFVDYDNDGDLDLFIPVGAFYAPDAHTNFLLRNDRGVFRDVHQEAGLTDALPTDNAIWLDYDRDGYLDLYTGNLACCPDDPTVRNKLYRNQGDGTFADVTAAAGLDVQFNSKIGGSNGGMAAGDFNDDGWPDLYVGVFEDRNRLFLNDTKGGFQDATTSEIADPGQAFGIAVGDIDNDGDLDLFQAAGGGSSGWRSLMLLNLGQGQFLDVTEGVGLGELGEDSILGATLADIDNDGDLDLTTPQPRQFLFLNDGSGFFVDRSTQSGIDEGQLIISVGDFGLDGFLDMLFGASLSKAGGTGRLYYNNGNGNHYLRVELVGARSNRNGIGARLLATAGDLQQMREILGGLGYNQDEVAAHFGLGGRTKVDRLEIRWPSGQVEVLTDIPADQKIRVIEGSSRYHRVEPTRWQQTPPETLVAGTTPQLNLAVQPALFDPEATITQVTADLSPLGGGAEVPLAAEGDGTYHRRDFPLPITAPNGIYTFHMMIDQATSLGPHWTRLSRQVTVVPAGDLVIFDEVVAPGWQVEGNRRLTKLEFNQTSVVHRGNLAGAFEGEAASAPWTVTFKPPAPVGLVGYPALRFAFHPGDVVPPRGGGYFYVGLKPGPTLNFVKKGWVELEKKEWQIVEVPLEAFGLGTPLEAIVFSGNFAGTFYLDDIRLVAATPSPITVVEEDRTAALPQSFSLSQNFPNPFNSQTLIRFELPESGEMELAIYNLAGQRVVKLVQGAREAGTYTIRWDGRDARGRDLASGIYLYRLRAGERVETRKLVLAR